MTAPIDPRDLAAEEASQRAVDAQREEREPAGSIKEGLHFDLDETLYHSHPTSLSVTGAKTLLRAPALYKWQREHSVQKDVFDFGKAAHARVLGVGAEVVVIDADAKRGKVWTEPADAARAEGKVPLLHKESDQLDAMAAELRGHYLASQLLSEGEAEVSAFGIDPATGVMRRSRFDYVESRRILSDYKTTVCSEPNAFIRSAAKFGYHQQHAWYLDIAEDVGIEPRAFAFIAQEKEPPYLVTVIELPADLVEAGRRRNRRALERFRDCTESGKWPGYVPDTEIATPQAKPYMLIDEEYDA